jgi:hypothetical protein
MLFILLYPDFYDWLIAMELFTESYAVQIARWPGNGRHILGQFDDHSVVVYQAYRPTIGNFAASHGYFGGEFSLNRMSWIKPNFLWMMHRSGWGTKEGQTKILAVWLKRYAFDTILEQAVHSRFVPEVFANKTAWEKAIANASVLLQWDPDHDPIGTKVERRAIQLGLRGDALMRYSHDWIIDIQDISEFVREQRIYAEHPYTQLITPRETVYMVKNSVVAARLGLSANENSDKAHK